MAGRKAGPERVVEVAVLLAWRVARRHPMECTQAAIEGWVALGVREEGVLWGSARPP